MSIYTARQRKHIVTACMLLLGVFLLYESRGILTALLSAVVLYTLFKRFYIYLNARLKFGRSLSAFLIIVISFLIIVLPMMALSWMIVHKILLFQKDLSSVNTVIDRINAYAGSNFGKPDLVQNTLDNASKWVLGTFSSVLSGAFATFLTLMIMYFTLYFMLVSHERFEKGMQRYLPFAPEHSVRFASELHSITYSNIIGQGLISLSQGIVVGIGFWIFHIPDPFFWGVISIFVCFLPVVGAPIIYMPAGLIELVYGHTFSGFGIMIWGTVLVLLIDNFLRSYISRKIADTHPLITIIGVVIGVPAFGLIGLVIGPLLLSYFILLMNMYESLHSSEEDTKDPVQSDLDPGSGQRKKSKD
jgi:predicted PurR-regulated permease PerM